MEEVEKRRSGRGSEKRGRIGERYKMVEIRAYL